jgi:hypothetical protein
VDVDVDTKCGIINEEPQNGPINTNGEDNNVIQRND